MYYFFLLLIIVGLTAYRAWVSMSHGMPLYVDEAQYWYWAQHLDWGYFSKPPMVAGVIAATTAVCGDGEFCVRAGSLLFYPLSTLLLFALVKRLFDVRVAFASAVMFITLPAVGLSSLLISTDVVLFFCWTLALYAFVRALDSNAWFDWLLLGMALGLGLLTKYTMGIFFVSALLYLLFTGRWHYLLNGRAWVAVLLAGTLFAPNLWWNWQHDFPTFQHTAEISHLEQAGWHWDSLGEFLLGQMGVFGLLFFPVLLVVLLRVYALQRIPHAGLLVSFTLPFLLLICMQALVGVANANWAAPAYVAGTVLLAAWLVRGGHVRLLAAGLALNIALFVALYHYPTLTRLLGVEVTAKTDVYKRLKGWDVLGQRYLALQQQYPTATLLADERGLLSELAYYARPQGLQLVSWNPDGLLRHHYDLVTSLAGREGQDFLYVTQGDVPEGMSRYFTALTRVGQLSVPIHAGFGLDYTVYHAQGFKGLAGK